MRGIDIHPSLGETGIERDLAESLERNYLDPKLLYVTPRQSELWRQVFLKHSPLHGNAEFARIYRDAFTCVAEQAAVRVWLVGLGCGTGVKERELCLHLAARGKEVMFSAVDASPDLVAQSSDAVVIAGAEPATGLVTDLADVDFLRRWLDGADPLAPRIFTFFGLVPNFEPSLVASIFRAVLRKGDLLLVSAHLAPVAEGMDVQGAMRRVLPQYDNSETLAWLGAALEQWGLDQVEAPRMTIGEIKGIPAFIGTASWKSGAASPHGEPLQVFRSLRYTPQLFEEWLTSEDFRFQRLAMTSCREEAIWAVRL